MCICMIVLFVHSPKRVFSEGYWFTFLLAASVFHSRDHLNINPLDLISYIVTEKNLLVQLEIYLEDEGTKPIYFKSR